jgi:tetratricopeptide (TPR) repeat protein
LCGGSSPRYGVTDAMNSNDAAGNRVDTGTSVELREVQKMLQAHRLGEAEAAIEKLVDADPADPEALYTSAVIKRLLKKQESALLLLEQLHDAWPEHSRGYQEKGLIWMARRDSARSVAAFERAVALDPALISSWKALYGLYQLDGNRRGLVEAKKRYENLRLVTPGLLAISTLINEKRFELAESRCRQFLQRSPDDVEALRLLAKIGTEVGILEDAERLLEKALALEPTFEAGRFDYVVVLQKRQKFFRAFEEARALMAAAPGDYNYRRLYANTCVDVARNEEAISIYHDVLTVDPENPQILLMCGHAAKTAGLVNDAIRYYQRSYRARPGFGDAFWSLANLKTYSLSPEERQIAEENEASVNTSLKDRIHLNFALGKAYEDQDEIELSFKHYERGNRLQLTEIGYSAQRVSDETDAQIEACSASFFEERQGWGNSASDPIFIVGLPRAGSTLLEQILASHSQVDGTRELPNILHLVAELGARRRLGEEARYPDVLSDLSKGDVAAFGTRYLKETQDHRDGAPHFTDKMPNNFRHIGLIKLILPNARIIDARRQPIACCWSAYKQLFAAGQAYTYGIEEIARYYRDYLRLMDHWDEVFPGQILRVNYEKVVDDFELQVERIIKFCGLDMEPGCLEFYQTKRSINTPSSEQVRQPIYRQGIDDWKRFETYLQPLKAYLGERP